MFSELSNSDWMIVSGIVAFVSLALGWVSNLVLDEVGMGLTVNTALSLIGGSLGIWIMERAIAGHWFRFGSELAGWWIGAYLIGAMIVLSLALIARRAATR